MDWTKFGEVLFWLAAGPGAAYIAGRVISLLADNWSGWEGLDSRIKFWIPVVLSVAIALGASMLLKLPEVIAFLQPYYEIIVLAIVAWFGSQVQYITSRQKGYGAAREIVPESE